MDENQIKKKYIKQISQIKKHNKYYFNDNNPKISDLEYDKLKKEILALESKHSFLKNYADYQLMDINNFLLEDNMEDSKKLYHTYFLH